MFYVNNLYLRNKDFEEFYFYYNFIFQNLQYKILGKKENLQFLKSNQRNILLLLSSKVFVVYIDTIKTISILIFINLLNMDAKITVNSFSLFFVNLLIKKLIRYKQLNLRVVLHWIDKNDDYCIYYNLFYTFLKCKLYFLIW